jgi:rod shape-determining protein MreC
VHDKSVRRRRAVLALLVVLSLLLLTAYFGESSEGGLHSVQQGFLTVVTPIENGASKALKPVRNLLNWFSETLHAKSQRDALLSQTERLRHQLVNNEAEKRGYKELLALFHLDQLGVSDYRPVTADVIVKTPNIWYQTVSIDAGSSSGIQVNDPVINGEGLVGKVQTVASDGAIVELITNPSMGVSARVGTSNATGVVQPKVGEPASLILQYLPAGAQANQGEYVVTSGTVAPPDYSLYPAGLIIGQVTATGEEGGYPVVDVHPTVNLHALDTVQVLTAPPGSRPAQLGRLLQSLPANGHSAGPEQLASTGGG